MEMNNINMVISKDNLNFSSIKNTYPFCWLSSLVILIRFSCSDGAGLFRQHKQQKQKNLVHELGVWFGFESVESIDVIESCLLRQHFEQQQSEILLQHGLQALKQFIRLQHDGGLSFGDIFSFIIFFCRKQNI